MTAVISTNALRLGDAVHDMHDTLDVCRLFGKSARIVSHTRLQIPGGSRLITLMFREFYDQGLVQRMRMYTNKTLVYLGLNEEGKYQFAYSYDDRVLGFIILENVQ